MAAIDLANVDQKQTQLLARAFAQKKLAHSYLFVASSAEVAVNTAYWLACLFNCTGQNAPDGQCQNCQQILSGNYPDVLFVHPEGRQTLGIDQIRSLKAELAKSPVESSCRFFIIDRAEKLTLPAANALLNLLEEPIAPVVTILLTNNSDQILPTIRSRTQIINFVGEGRLANKTAELLQDGFTHEQIEELGETKSLDQVTKYFYQEMLESNLLAFVSAHKLADAAKTASSQQYVLHRLKSLAQKELTAGKQLTAAKMLKCLIEVDKMRFSNVSFRNLLDYLALQWRQ